MKRRAFVGAVRDAGILAGGGWLLGPGGSAASAAGPSAQPGYDLVAVKNGAPDALFDAGIEALGGMRRFVRTNQTVVVKPNIGWDVVPERAANTNPLLVKRIIEQCLAAGAKKVYCFDYTCDNWRRAYKHSGIEAAVKDAGGIMAPGNSERYFQAVSVGGRKLHEAKEHELILEVDCFINVPVLKDHGSATLTVSMKNLMGTIWDRRFWHRNDLHQCIADFAGYRRPDLNIVDAYRVMKANGPRGVSERDVVEMRTQLISTDMVSADAAAARLLGLDPERVSYIRLAAERGAGRMDLEQLSIGRIVL